MIKLSDGTISDAVGVTGVIFEILESQSIPAAIVTNGSDWAFLSLVGGKPLLEKRTWQDVSEWLIYFAQINIMRLQKHLLLHFKTVAVQIADELLWHLERDTSFGAKDVSFLAMKDLINASFETEILRQIPYFNNLMRVDEFFKTHLSKHLTYGEFNSALKVMFQSGHIFFDEEAQKVLISTIEFLGVERVFNAQIETSGKIEENGMWRKMRLVERIKAAKNQAEVQDSVGKIYYITLTMNNEQKVKVLEKLNAGLSASDSFSVFKLFL